MTITFSRNDCASINFNGTCPATIITTDISGNYSFTGLSLGSSYIVTPTLTGHIFTPANQTFNNLTGTQTANFTAVQVVTVSGRLNGTGGNNFTVSISCNGFSANQLTSGNFTFLVPSNSGTCTVTPSSISQSGGSFGWNPSATQIAVGTQNIANVDFTIITPTFNVVGTINNLANAPGTTVSASGRNCPISGSVYTCSNLVIFQSYTVTPSHPTTTFTRQSNSYSAIQFSFSNQNFTAIATQTISGQVTRNGAALSGVTVALSGGATATRQLTQPVIILLPV